MTTDRDLPPLAPLPRPDSTVYGPNRTVLGHAFLAEKVRAYAQDYARAAIAAMPSKPIDMVLHCPKCGKQHIDKESKLIEIVHQLSGTVVDEVWSHPPHCSHLCYGCGHIWRPADVPTHGVAAVKTKGKGDSPIAQPAQAQGEPVAPSASHEEATRLADAFERSADWLELGTLSGPSNSQKYVGTADFRSASKLLRAFIEQPVADIQRDAQRLDALEATTFKDAWIVMKNTDSFTVYLRLRGGGFATRKTLRAAIDAAMSEPQQAAPTTGGAS